jgi:hypothetical protein
MPLEGGQLGCMPMQGAPLGSHAAIARITCAGPFLTSQSLLHTSRTTPTHTNFGRPNTCPRFQRLAAAPRHGTKPRMSPQEEDGRLMLQSNHTFQWSLRPCAWWRRPCRLLSCPVPALLLLEKRGHCHVQQDTALPKALRTALSGLQAHNNCTVSCPQRLRALHPPARLPAAWCHAACTAAAARR